MWSSSVVSKDKKAFAPFEHGTLEARASKILTGSSPGVSLIVDDGDEDDDWYLSVGEEPACSVVPGLAEPRAEPSQPNQAS
jgi:hypothetical protein